MPWPPNVNTVTVTADAYLGALGGNLSGYFIFAPNVDLADPGAPAIIRAAPTQVTVTNGTMPAQVLAATDNTTLTPANWAWTLTEVLQGAPVKVWSFQLPHTDGPTVDLAALTPLATPPALVQYLLAINNLGDLPNPAAARASLSAAKSGANSDITSLAGLTTPLPLSEGGTGLATPPAVGQEFFATSATTGNWFTRDFNLAAFGAVGDGATDDTAAINRCFTAAAAVPGSSVYVPPAPGGCYRTTGFTIPGGVSRVYGSCDLDRANFAGSGTPSTLTGSVFAPKGGTVTNLVTIGANVAGVPSASNPHGLRVEGIGFLGTTGAGFAIANFWAVIVQDTSDVTFAYCADLYCDSWLSSGAGGPSGGPSSGTGGWLQVLSSGSGNGLGENCRVMFHSSLGAGKIVSVDGNAAGNGGSTDGRIFRMQSNGHHQGILFGPANAGTGGWSVEECHLSATAAINHLTYGQAGTPWSLRVLGCYFDIANGPSISCSGRGMQVTGCYFRGNTNTTFVSYGSTLTTSGRDPAGLLADNVIDLNNSTTVKAFAQFNAFTAALMATNGGGEYSKNLIHNHGHAMPASWISPFIGSDNLAVATTSTATLDLVSGPVLSA